jgi:hypothetical protein
MKKLSDRKNTHQMPDTSPASHHTFEEISSGIRVTAGGRSSHRFPKSPRISIGCLVGTFIFSLIHSKFGLAA